MIWYILLFIVFYFLFVTIYYGIKLRSNFLFYLYLGKKRTGKSTHICKMAIKYLKRGYDVYVNSDDIRINGVRHYRTQDLGSFDVKRAVLFIDEISLFYDNRNFKHTSKDFISWLRGIGHDKLIVFAYSQSYDCDSKIRTLADSVFLMRKYFNCYTVARKLQKNIAIKDSAINAESQIVDEIKFIPFFFPGATSITFIPHWIKYFDSFADLQSGRNPLQYVTTIDGYNVPGSFSAIIRSLSASPMTLTNIYVIASTDLLYSLCPSPSLPKALPNDA